MGVDHNIEKGSTRIMQAHQHWNTVIFYPSDIYDDGKPVETERNSIGFWQSWSLTFASRVKMRKSYSKYRNMHVIQLMEGNRNQIKIKERNSQAKSSGERKTG